MKSARKKTKAIPKFIGRFNPAEAQALGRIFLKITDSGRLDRTQFRDILHSTFDMNDDSLMDRMFRTFDHDSDGYLTCNEWLTGLWIFLKGNVTEQTTYCFQVYDIDGDGYLSKSDLFQLLKSSLRPAIAKAMPFGQRGGNEQTPADSPRTARSHRQITRGHTEEADKEIDLDLVDEDKPSGGPTAAVMGNNEDDPDEGPRDLSEMALSLLDRDLDGRVSLEDFLQSVQNDYLLMEILGSCLPSGARAAAVLAALSGNGTLPISVPPPTA
ncbi:EF-hand calcium-binding domain-containing protein 1-like [Daphnia pulex]|uniref:EF-hand calcium-binding domain-containing protein 1-like n=1 Tax=Daphnia pulex TaxID=6669 RepID=UPI001EDD9A67|nr:EF-hand calcium-binding domain-containing protein 1-like [Daphnia pulex]XP_046653185.1 EF-hand calcium-binding domain-containing protein 1-like [Daphnia pulicaria]